MKNILIILVVLCSATTLVAKKKEKKQEKNENISAINMVTPMDSFSYSAGIYFMEQVILPGLKQGGDDTIINKAIFVEGLTAAIKQQAIFTTVQAEKIISRYFELKSRKEKTKDSILSLNNKKLAQEFLDKNKTQPQVQTTSSGLQYKIITQGTGKKPMATNQVEVHYEGKLLDGTVFDSSYERNTPATLLLNQVIAGWTEGIQLLNEGGEMMLYIPSELGYGNQTVQKIPGGSLLIFKIQLISIGDDVQLEESAETPNE